MTVPRKRPDLKKRFDDIRHEPEPSIEVRLSLEADLYRLFKTLAAGEQLSLEAYLTNALVDHAERVLGDGDE